MQSKTFLAVALAAIAAPASAQTMNLTALIGSTPSLSSLAAILHLPGQSEIATSLANATNITLFAPSNAAFNTLNTSGALAQAASAQGAIQALLDYHVVPGMIYAQNVTETPAFAHTLLNDTTYSNVTGGQVVECRLEGQNVTLTSGLKNNANVTMANLNFTGGVLHVIDSVLTIPPNVSYTASAANLTSFLGALQAANLSSAVNGLSDVTIFAPSNDAFQAIGSATGNLSDEQIASILQYHVINGSVAYSSSLGNGSVPTMGGGNVTITVADGSVFVNSARVINADLLVSGGVMHVIDSVLNPNNSMASAVPSATSATGQFSGASSATTVPFTSGIPTATVTATQLVATTIEVASGYSTVTAGPLGTAAGGSGSSSTSSKAMAAMHTGGAIGAAALFGGAAFAVNW